MRISTVPQITKRIEDWPGKVSDLSENDQNELYLAGRSFYKNLIQKQFQLCYHAHISIEDLDNMSRYEYEMFYEELRSQKEAEKKAIEDSATKSK